MDQHAVARAELGGELAQRPCPEASLRVGADQCVDESCSPIQVRWPRHRRSRSSRPAVEARWPPVRGSDGSWTSTAARWATPAAPVHDTCRTRHAVESIVSISWVAVVVTPESLDSQVHERPAVSSVTTHVSSGIPGWSIRTSVPTGSGAARRRRARSAPTISTRTTEGVHSGHRTTSVRQRPDVVSGSGDGEGVRNVHVPNGTSIRLLRNTSFGSVGRRERHPRRTAP